VLKHEKAGPKNRVKLDQNSMIGFQILHTEDHNGVGKLPERIIGQFELKLQEIQIA
jgi:hypothetical protein